MQRSFAGSCSHGVWSRVNGPTRRSPAGLRTRLAFSNGCAVARALRSRRCATRARSNRNASSANTSAGISAGGVSTGRACARTKLRSRRPHAGRFPEPHQRVPGARNTWSGSDRNSVLLPCPAHCFRSCGVRRGHSPCLARFRSGASAAGRLARDFSGGGALLRDAVVNHDGPDRLCDDRRAGF